MNRLSVTAVALSIALAVAFTAAVGPASAEPVRVDAAFDHAVMWAGRHQTAWLRVGLTGLVPAGDHHRAPLNVAIVIDRSGSMAGQKIAQAKQAAIAALSRMRADDIVAIVAYDSTVSVIVPATKVGDRRAIEAGIRTLRAGGNTALFAGTVKGAEEVRKFFGEGRVNRVILLSDGRANIGPDSPTALAGLGRSLRAEGIGVTTVGLGLDYNEDLMVALARSSGAAFTYVENARDLSRLYQEGFSGLARIVAKEIVVRMRFEEGFRPVRCLGRDAEIVGQEVVVPIAQLYGGATDEVVIEFETPRVEASSREAVLLDVSYHWLPTASAERSTEERTIHFSASAAQVRESVAPKVMEAVVQRLADARARHAIELRDRGDIEAAQRELEATSRYLEEQAKAYDSTRLRKQQVQTQKDAKSVGGKYWRRSRKQMQRTIQRYSDEDVF